MRQARILVVDDDAAIADSLQCILTMAGHEAVAAYSAAEALQRARSFHPQLVIADVVMPPGKSGFELAAELRRTIPADRIILLSGNAGTEELLAQAGPQLEGVIVLAKPFPPRELIRIINEFMKSMAA
jgi:CheY-like chemotaxis protein